MAQLQTRAVEYQPANEFETLHKAEQKAVARNSGALQNLRLLWDGRGLLFRMVMIGLVIGTLVAFLIPPRYSSVVRLMPPDGQSSSGMAMLAALSGKSAALGGIAGDLLGGSGSGALFVGILQSRTVQQRLVQRFDLKHVYRDRLDEDARKDLSERTGITDERKSGIITITVTDRRPDRASAMAQAYVDELNRLSAELSTSAAHRERVFLEERLKAVKTDLDQAATDFSQFSSKNATIDLKEQARAMVEAAAQLQGELIAAESQQKGLEAIYSSNNPRVLAVKARTVELRKQLEKIGGGGVGENGAQKSDPDQYPSIRQLPLLGVTYSDLYRRTKIQEAVYEALTQQYELAKVQEAKETPSVKVLDPANLPERKSFPPRILIILMGVALASTAGVVWLFGRSGWDQMDSMDSRKLFVEEVVHSIEKHMPWAPPNGSRGQAIAHQIWKRVAQRTPVSPVSEESQEHP